MKNLEGRVAVVTGAASGLGRAMANRFAAEGMRVVLSDIETDALDLAVTALSDAGHDVRGVVTDVADETAVQRLADEAFAIYGAVHVLCNNAGVNKRARIWELTTDDWNWVINVDLWSVVYGVRAFIPRMIELGQGGHIINTASMAALLPMPNLGAYAVAKAGVMALSRPSNSNWTRRSAGSTCRCWHRVGFRPTLPRAPATDLPNSAPSPRPTAEAPPPAYSRR